MSSRKQNNKVNKSTPAEKLMDESVKQEDYISRAVVREMIRVQQEAIMACFNNVMGNISNKVDGIIRDVQELKTSLEFTNDIQENKLSVINKTIEKVQEELKNTTFINYEDRLLIKQQKEKVIDLEDRSRRNNLRIDGLPENQKETWDDTEEKVKQLFKEKLLINKDIEIDRAHRTGRTQAGKSRSIVLRCLRFKDKELILRMANKLKDTGIYINEDFSVETLHTRKELFQKAKEYRSKGMGAKVTAGKLITWEIAKVDDEH